MQDGLNQEKLVDYRIKILDDECFPVALLHGASFCVRFSGTLYTILVLFLKGPEIKQHLNAKKAFCKRC